MRLFCRHLHITAANDKQNKHHFKECPHFWSLISLFQAVESVGGYTTESVTHGQCDARPTVTFPATEHHRPMVGTNLYCLMNRGTGVWTTCSRSFVKWSGWDSNLWPLGCKSDTLPTRPPRHTLFHLIYYVCFVHDFTRSRQTTRQKCPVLLR